MRMMLYWKVLARIGQEAGMQIRVNVDRLREYMLDEYGTAAFGGFPAAAMDAWEVERMSGEELCREAERKGVDLRRFQA